MRTCPNCNSGIRLRTIKDNFNCPSCNIELESNINAALAIGFIIWFLIIGTIIIAAFSQFGILSIIIDLTVGLTFMYLLLRTFLKLKLKNRNGVS
jgi:uncharacterized protein (DUF983 family)